MNTHSRTAIAIALAATLTLIATSCSPAPTEMGPSTASIRHVHDIAFAPDGALLIGGHTGAYRVDLATGDVSLIGQTTFDAMGLTVQADSILASGHPDPSNQNHTFTPPNIGLVRWTDAGWEQVSLAGMIDFHTLATSPAAPALLLGLPSDRAVLAASTDAGQTWTDRAPLTARDLSIDTIEPDIVTATTPDGLMVSRDAGTTFSPVVNAPTFLIITADPAREEGIIGVDANGAIWTGSTTPGTAWSAAGHATGVATAITVSPDGTVAIADEAGVRITSDSGKTWHIIVNGGPAS